MGIRVAYLAEGRLFVVEQGGEAREVASQFGESLRQRIRDLRSRRGWPPSEPAEGAVAGVMVLGDEAHEEDDPDAVELCALARGREGCLLYGLRARDLSGIFEYDCAADEEHRLLHERQLELHSISAPDAEGRLICSMSTPEGGLNLAIYEPGGGGLTQVTEGDSLDGAAVWEPGGEGAVVYQSAGIGRNANGKWVATGACSIQRCDPQLGATETLLESPRHDFLAPRIAADGSLYCIRRPWGGARRATFSNWLRGLASRLIWKRPESDGATSRGELMRLDADRAEPEKLVSGVAAFDLGDAGEIAYATDDAIRLLRANDDDRLLVTVESVSQIVLFST